MKTPEQIKLDVYAIDGVMYIQQFPCTDEYGRSCFVLYAPAEEVFKVVPAKQLKSTTIVVPKDLDSFFSIPQMYMVVTSKGHWQQGTKINTIIQYLLRLEAEGKDEMTYVIHRSDYGMYPVVSQMGGVGYYTSPDRDRDSYQTKKTVIKFTRPKRWKLLRKRLESAEASFGAWGDRNGFTMLDYPNFAVSLDFEDRWEWTIEGDEIPELYINDKE